MYEWRRRTIRAEDIRRVKGIRYTDYGQVEWHMKLRYGRRRAISVDFFDDAREFVRHITTLNPRIEVSGEWPSIGFPVPVVCPDPHPVTGGGGVGSSWRPGGGRWAAASATHTYHVHRTRELVWLIIPMTIGGFFLLIGLAGVTTRDITSGLFWIAFEVVWLVIALDCARQLLRSDWTIEVVDVGMMAFLSKWGEPRTVRIEDIAEVHIGMTKGKQGKTWELKIRDLAGYETEIDYFKQANAFVEHLLALNPHIAVSGQ